MAGEGGTSSKKRVIISPSERNYLTGNFSDTKLSLSSPSTKPQAADIF